MSLLRNSILAAAGTTVAGIGLMELSSSKPFSLPKPSWYLQASILTGVAGGIGYFLVNNKYTPEEIKMDAESPTDDELESWSERQDDGSMLVMIDEDGDSHTELTYDEDGELTKMKRFAAEVFNADRKIRRRTRWTWKKGFEPKYAGHETVDEYQDAVGYDISDDYYNRRSYSWEPVYPYDEKSTYHISDLPEGYHLHLWKPARRSKDWKAFGKTPNMEGWEEWEHTSKGEMTADLLEWYNQDIAKPEMKELTPMQKFVISKGLKSGKVQINRVEHPKVEKEVKDRETGTISYKTVTPHIIEYFASGGPDQLEPKKIAEIRGRSPHYITSFSESSPYYHVQPFLQGLSFLGWDKSGDNRSVNRFNKDASTWPNVYPAWFKNAIKQTANHLEISQRDYQDTWEDSFGRTRSFAINGNSMIRFLNGKQHYSHRWRGDETMYSNYGNISGVRENITVYDKPHYQFEVWTEEGWYRPRKSTQQKLYEAAMTQDLNGDWVVNQEHFVTLVCDKYQFEKLDMVKESITQNMLEDEASESRFENAVHLMLRRFKKNDK
tara:strand:- start:119 stop:1771 length:1653 start_codon:yes stop_codon:yes gene_type:complete